MARRRRRSGIARRGKRYWSTGKGGLAIRWNTPGDFTRCVRKTRPYLGVGAEGYCARLHKRNTGKWPGEGKRGKRRRR